MMASIGICIGATTVSVVRLATEKVPTGGDDSNPLSGARVVKTAVYPHEGNPRTILRKALKDVDYASADRIGATGRKFRHYLNLPSISEPEAVESAYAQVKPPGIDCPAIIAAGGETFMVYKLDDRGQISNVFTGNKCAAGTGEFFQQQLRRLGACLEEAAQWAAETEPYGVSGRCSVFCKSDCTHATNKGIPKERVAAGLGRMMANKIIELLKRVDHRHLMLTGGTARNQMMVTNLKKALPGLIIPQEAPFFEAFGAAVWACRQPEGLFPDEDSLFLEREAGFDKLPALEKYADHVVFKKLTRAVVQPADHRVPRAAERREGPQAEDDQARNQDALGHDLSALPRGHGGAIVATWAEIAKRRARIGDLDRK